MNLIQVNLLAKMLLQATKFQINFKVAFIIIITNRTKYRAITYLQMQMSQYKFCSRNKLTTTETNLQLQLTRIENQVWSNYCSQRQMFRDIFPALQIKLLQRKLECNYIESYLIYTTGARKKRTAAATSQSGCRHDNQNGVRRALLQFQTHSNYLRSYSDNYNFSVEYTNIQQSLLQEILILFTVTL